MSSLLEQAIVDAKQLREAALQNAENIVIEKYSDEVKANVQSLLEQEEKPAQEKLSDVAKQVPDAYFKPIDEEVPVIIDLDELDAQLKKAVVKESLDEEGCIGEQCGGAAPTVDRFGRNSGPEAPRADGREVIGLEEEEFDLEEDFDLEEEIDLDEALLEMYADDDLEEAVDMDLADRSGDGEVQDWELAIATAAFGDDEGDEGDEGAEEIEEADDMLGSPEDLRKAREFVNDPKFNQQRSRLAAGDKAARDKYSRIKKHKPTKGSKRYQTKKTKPGGSLKEHVLGNIEEQVLDNLYEKMTTNIDDIGRSGWGNLGTPDVEIEEMMDMISALEETLAEESEQKEDLKNENKDLRHAGIILKENNDNLRSAVGVLKEKLEQTNVSNAKLLYINQAIGNASLNERQKDKIVEAISRAESVKEAKVIYETLQGTVGQDTYKSPLPQSLSEVVSSRSSSMLMAGHRPEKTKSNPLKDRMQILAGIK